MSLSIRLNGEDYGNFTSAQVIRSIETAAWSFSFTSTTDKDNRFQIKLGDMIEVIAEDEVASTAILKGWIESVRVGYDPGSHDITVKGRSLLADLIDSTVGPIKEFVGQVSLIDICRNVLDGIGLTDIEVINEAGDIDNFAAEDITSAETGQLAFDFLESYARKRQVLITTNTSGDLVIARASTEVSDLRLIHTLDDGGVNNNIKSGVLDSDGASLFNTYIVNSQLNPVNLNANTSPTDIVDQAAQILDELVRDTRRMEFYSEESSESFTLNDRAKWESNIRRARATIYTATVQGHASGGEVWEPNKLYQIDDDYCDVHALLLASRVTHKYDLDSGSTTTISFTNRDAYTLQAEQDAREAETNTFGVGF